MDDVLAFVQQNWPTALVVVLMVLMHTFGHGAHGRGGHGEGHSDERHDDRAVRREPLDRGSAPGGPRA